MAAPGSPPAGPDGGPRVVAVGSTNPAKVEPVGDLLRRLFGTCRVEAVGVPSGVAAQPLSLEETRRGAEGRARAALEALDEAVWGVGIEGGMHLEAGERGWLVTVAAVADRQGRISTGEGMRLALPPLMVRALLAGQELAEVVDAWFGTEGARVDPGAVGLLTRGLVTRRHLVADAVLAALVPRLHPELYGI